MIKAGNKESNFEILLSTMNRNSLSFLEQMFPEDDFLNYNILIINQTSKGNQLKSEFANIRVINSFETGLSKSRNQAIINAKGNICIIADDDVKYVSNLKNIILKAFEKNQDADIITFQMVDDSGKLFKNYPDIVKHNKKTVYTVNSVVIALKMKSLQSQKVFYNEHFGLGSKFQTADEYVFLRNALKSNLSVFFEPKIVLSHNIYSSGKDVGSDRIIYALSALFYKFSGVLAYIRLLKYLFIIYINGDIAFSELWHKCKVGIEGIAEYKRLLKLGLETR